MTTVSIQGKTYNIYQLTGTVLDNNKQREMHVHGGSDVNYKNLSGMTSVTSRTKVKSTTTIHDQFFIMDDRGQEHDIKLSNWDVTLRTGHRIQMIWVIPEHKKFGTYVALNNLNLKKIQRNRQAIQNLATNHNLKLFCGGTLGILIISFMIKLILLPILGIIGAIIYSKKCNQVTTELQAAIDKEIV